MKIHIEANYLTIGFLALLVSINSFADQPGRLLAANNNDCRNPVAACSVTDPEHLKGRFLELDPDTGASTQIALLSNSAPSLAFSDHEGMLFASYTVLQLPLPAQSQLFRVDPDSGAASFVGVISNSADPTIEYGVQAMAFDQDGQLYGVDRRSDSLLQIDHTTALATPVGTGLGFVVRGNGGTIWNGMFYLLSGNVNFPIDLWKVDLSTGIAQLVGPTGLQDGGIGLTEGPNDNLLAVVNDKLYELDGVSGAASLIGAIGVPLVSSLVFVDAISYACPCAGKADGPKWKNHGKYVSCVTKVANQLKKDGEITGAEKGAIVSAAAQSSCGKP